MMDEGSGAMKHEIEGDTSGQDSQSPGHVKVDNTQKSKEEDTEHRVGKENGEAMAEVNMEAAITTDDVIRAGGFGARDDLSSLLPVAIDSTDFESSLRDARDFEEPQGEVARPGLGWVEP